MYNYTRQDYFDKKQDFSDKISVAIMVGLVVLSLIANTIFKDKDPAPADVVTDIRFPAYETEVEAVNKAMPFHLNIKLPDQWEVKPDGDTEKFPQVNLYNPYFIYSGENCIGYIGFNVFTPPEEEPVITSYHQHVWPVIDSGIMPTSINQYMIVRLTDKFEAGYCELNVAEKAADAVLCYNRDVHNMVGIVLEKGVADEAALQQICLSLSFSVA
ncbi:MAG: hypothetical protein E7492_06270 [Ruminococcaceae bacterium]|nr:hypothetical protein [Oscillospiraceae bacterium]